MDENYANEDFLTRWIAGALTPEELAGFEASDVYRQLMAIDNTAQSLNGPEIDVEKALALVTEKNKNVQKEPKVRRLWWVAAVASIALLFAGYTYFYGYKTYSTGIGENETVLLADGSLIELNANSKLSYKRFGWEEDRIVDFEGEAFFDVQPSGNFTVNTRKGTIAVLGTQFNIRDRKDFKVQCYEGVIVFTPLTQSNPTELSQGMALEIKEGQLQQTEFSADAPDWKKGYSSFMEQPFSEVLEELSVQFPVTFELNSVQIDRLFTGRFTHKNLENALKTTMEPMGITYHISADKRIVTLSGE
ncbi:FecR family protein [Muricauda sp. MAR_2010_75]|jgi:ferric-dicitrate binding protein FerR (iron transport regulator)|uniref:FecR family protein n=1 Tax=Allomuricauda sp. MAR_2010_75 TaxID=1250232 RepID=UPI0005675908|nr:FecR domain-containing protein [Muricauda sp. MAR_2010_75]